MGRTTGWDCSMCGAANQAQDLRCRRCNEVRGDVSTTPVKPWRDEPAFGCGLLMILGIVAFFAFIVVVLVVRGPFI